MERAMRRTDRLEERFLAVARSVANLRANGVTSALAKLRHDAQDSFASMGFPKPRSEAWKYTNIRSALRKYFPTEPVGSTPPAGYGMHGLNTDIAAFVNGRYSAAHSRNGPLPKGTIVGGLQAALGSHKESILHHLGRLAPISSCPFVALNTAALSDGAFIFVPENTRLERPLQVVHMVTSGVFFQPRTLLIAEADASVEVILSISTPPSEAAFANTVTEVSVGPGADVNAYTIQPERDRLTTVTALNVHQGTGSRFGSYTATFGGEVARNNLTITADAAHCDTFLNGLFLARGNSHIDNHTLVDHAMPDCESSELYKGILDEQSTGVFNGKVMVRQDAQRINAYQSSKAVVLTHDARMFAKPELEIYADDVKCSHGATTGQLEKEALFYLRSRGLSEKQARDLLLEAFAREFTEGLPNGEIKHLVEQLISGWLTR